MIFWCGFSSDVDVSFFTRVACFSRSSMPSSMQYPLSWRPWSQPSRVLPLGWLGGFTVPPSKRRVEMIGDVRYEEHSAPRRQYLPEAPRCGCVGLRGHTYALPTSYNRAVRPVQTHITLLRHSHHRFFLLPLDRHTISNCWALLFNNPWCTSQSLLPYSAYPASWPHKRATSISVPRRIERCFHSS
jgi:hypothetical protein